MFSPRGCKRSRSKHPTPSHAQKFKKIVEMAAEEILGPVPASTAVAETATSGEDEPEPLPQKRGVGQPPSATKKQPGLKVAKGNTVQALQQPRSTLRRREVQEIVPVKFRGM